MRLALIFFFLLGSVGAFAQSSKDQKPARNPEWDSSTYYVEQTSVWGPGGGYLTLVSADPLEVAEDPVFGYTLHASVFVNPVSATLTVDFKDEIPTQRVTIAISDTAGKLLLSKSFFPKGKAHIFSIAKLKSPGTYRVAVYREDKRVLYWGDFLKR